MMDWKSFLGSFFRVSNTKESNKGYINKNAKHIVGGVLGSIVQYLGFIGSGIIAIIANIVAIPSDVKMLYSFRHKAAVNNFILGKKMLRGNNLLDAKFRFLLAERFSNNAPLVKYYLAYVYYREGSYRKSLKKLQECISKRPNMARAIDLFYKIQNILESSRVPHK